MILSPQVARNGIGCTCIVLGVLSFILLAERTGMLPATFVSVFISSLGDRDGSLKSSLLLAGAITVLCRSAVLLRTADPVAAPDLVGQMLSTALTDLWHGFGVALEPHNFFWCFVGVLIGNLVGVLPGLGVMAAISILLPLTFGMKAVSAILMLAGIYYGAQYGGAICSILLNLPCHPPHAVTCLDGYPLTQQGRGGVALGITMLASFVGASFGIIQMIFFAPTLVELAFKFGPAEICSLMLLGLLAGSTLARGSPTQGDRNDDAGARDRRRRHRYQYRVPLRFTLGIPGPCRWRGDCGARAGACSE